jgi:uncharacterized protein YheU (UPF0270 family)
MNFDGVNFQIRDNTIMVQAWLNSDELRTIANMLDAFLIRKGDDYEKPERLRERNTR